MLLSNVLIGLREGLEAALVVSILVAFLVRTDRRRALPLVWAGVGAAVALSVAVGAALSFTESSLSTRASEGFGGITSIVAVALVTGMIFWMRSTARKLSGELRGKLSHALEVGPVAVVLMAFLATGREGLETAVFFFSAVQAAKSTTQPLLGFCVGIAVAVALAWLMYRGALRINLARFFRVTGALLVLVAAGILAYGMHDLQEAGLLPGLTALAFDVSGAVPTGSWYGTLLKGIFNFSPQTTVLEAAVWLGYVGVVLPLFLLPQRTRPRAPEPATAQTA